jgi:hypothetical protein
MDEASMKSTIVAVTGPDERRSHKFHEDSAHI